MTQCYSRNDTVFQGDSIFTIPFSYIHENDINIFINDIKTTKWSFLNYSQIKIEENLTKGDLISIRRVTPIDEKIVDYENMSMVLDEDNLNLSQDQLLYSMQEIYDHTAINTEATNKFINNVDKIIAETQSYRDESALNVLKSAEQADLAKQYAHQVEYGVRWQPFTITNWTPKEDKFILTLSEASTIILGIYRITDNIKEQVTDIDVSVHNNQVTLTSLEAFDGGILSASKTMGCYTHEQTLEANEWLITHNLGKYPVVTIADYEGFVQVGTIQYLSLNQVRVTFNNDIAGFAYLT